MKLKCATHNRRVFSTPTGFLHRTGELGRCDARTAILRDNTSRTTRQFAVRNGEFVQTLTHKG